jgi:hypothetical protein
MYVGTEGVVLSRVEYQYIEEFVFLDVRFLVYRHIFNNILGII